jgi:N-acetylglucosaminyldiphosphoundecaprenol N-acetyl-beta-D-mannosaminyltransferase
MICDNEVTPAVSTGSVPRILIGHALVHSCSFDEVVEAIVRDAAIGEEPKYVVTPNAQHVVLLENDEHLRQVFSQAAFVLPDGFSLLLAARIMGHRFLERIAGVDMFEALCRRAACEGLRIFLLGGRPGSAEGAAEKLRAQYRGLIVCGTCCPPLGFENDPSQQKDIEECIRSARPHLLFVAFGAPKQEYWMYKYSRNLRVPVAMGVGGSFEMVSGVVTRAPKWLQKNGLEWLYRLLREPRRLWRRYLVGHLQFASIILQQRLKRQNVARSSFES